MNLNWLTPQVWWWIAVIAHCIVTRLSVNWLWNWARKTTHGNPLAKELGPVLYFLSGILFVMLWIACT